MGHALTLAPEPELLVLDDPAQGLDPVARRSLLESIIFVTRDQGRTVFLSSHLLGDVERVADEIAVLDRGVLRAHCSLETFCRRITRFVLSFDGLPPELPAIPGMLHALRTEGEISLTVANADTNTSSALSDLNPVKVEQTPISLEEAFIDYLGERGQKSLLHSDREEAT